MRVYPHVFTHVLSRMNPEAAHHLAFVAIRALGAVKGPFQRFFAPHRSLRVHTLGMTFPSPFGLAAGFDKDAQGIEGLGALGFGHVEVGTLTPVGQDGNPQPRLFRLIEDRAVINRMGFNNGGAWRAVTRLEEARAEKIRPAIGVNIGKNLTTSVDNAVSDYIAGTEQLASLADYLAVNVSSPNTPGLRGLQELGALEPLLQAVRAHAGDTPVLVKIAPDMNDEQIDAIVDLVIRVDLQGIIATNTTISREGLHAAPEQVTAIGAGGLSGTPLKGRAMEVLHRIRERAPKGMCVISVGGVTTAQDVLDRLDAGATLVQGYTAFLYEGPFWARQINRGLRERGWTQPISS